MQRGSALSQPSGEAFDPFSAAEDACRDVLEAVLEEGGQLLYQHYIERRSFPFAVQATNDALLGELAMYFVPYDEGEPPHGGDAAEADPGLGDGWTLEPEPTRCPIDTWARMCVPIKKKLVAPKRDQSTPDKATPMSTSMKVSRTIARKGTMSWPQPPSPTGRSTPKVQILKLPTDEEEDEEEAGLREMKDREARRLREEQSRAQKTAADEAGEETARLAQSKKNMKDKPCAYDSDGKILWVQPPAPQRFPSTQTVPNYAVRKEEEKDGGPAKVARPPRPTKFPALVAKPPKAPEFTDGFQRVESQQPATIDSMALVPGVTLLGDGKRMTGGARPSGTMSRREYEEGVRQSEKRAARHAQAHPAEVAASHDPARSWNAGAASATTAEAETPLTGPPNAGAPGGTAAEAASPSFTALAKASAETPLTGAPDGRKGDASQRAGSLPASGEADGSNRRRVKSADHADAKLVPVPPTTPRPLQPVPPPASRRLQARRQALGLSACTRERAPVGTGSRFPGCAPKPPLGATMGHGLLPKSHDQMHEEYYFPSAAARASDHSTSRLRRQ